MRLVWLSVVVAFAGCASAGKPDFNQHPDGSIRLDSSGPGQDGTVFLDAPAAGARTLSETSNATDDGSGIACSGTGFTVRNSYYRVFALSDFGISGSFNVTAVDFVTSIATASPALKVSVGTYSGTAGGATLTSSKISLAVNQTLTPADTQTAVPEHVPLTTTIAAGSNLIVEIDQTNKGTSGNGIEFFIGANAQSETAPGYLSSPDGCTATPTSVTQENSGTQTSILITVTGTT